LGNKPPEFICRPSAAKRRREATRWKPRPQPKALGAMVSSWRYGLS
jgi:hypothetical protein